MQDDNPQSTSPYQANPYQAKPDHANPDHATETLTTAAHDAKAAVQSAVHDAKEQVKHVGADAKEKGAGKVDAATDGAAEALRQVSSQLKNAVDGLGGEQPWAGKAFQTGADGLDRVSDYLASGRFDDFTRDIQSFARTNPAAFLAGGVALGFLIARVGKTAAHHAVDSAHTQQASSVDLAAGPTPAPVDGSALGVGGLS